MLLNVKKKHSVVLLAVVVHSTSVELSPSLSPSLPPLSLLQTPSQTHPYTPLLSHTMSAPTFSIQTASPAHSASSSDSIQPIHHDQDHAAAQPQGAGQTEQGHSAMNLGAKGFLMKKMAAAGSVPLLLLPLSHSLGPVLPCLC